MGSAQRPADGQQFERSSVEATGPATGPVACMARVAQAINGHDLDALAACFDADYQSTFPAHPDRAFRGRDQMRENWTEIFRAVPDIQASLLHCVADGDTVWAEWEWRGTRLDSAPFLQRGVTIQGVPRGQITWVRLYMEPVQESGPGIAAVRQSTREGAQ